MSKIEVSEKIKNLKSALKKMGMNLLDSSLRFGANKETREILKGQIDNINENFLFVIVGEVNAGKSSFVNALLGSSVCATSHEICTQDVQKIVYGNSERLIEDAHQRVITREFPAEILKEITVVDTPGTNSRELDHQIITEQFIPKCNLVLFIFQLDNIHVQSAWDLFRKIKGNWSKKVVFILTKADRYTEEEKTNYSNTLHKYAVNENVDSPLIFVTSAKQEDEEETEKSGFSPVRDYINSDVLKDAALKKIMEDAKIIRKLMADIDNEFGLRKSKFSKDSETREKINSIILSKESLTLANIKSLINKCMNVFDANTEKTLNQLNKGIGFFSFTFKSIRSIFGGENTKTWLENVNKGHVENLNKDTNLVLEGGTDSLKSDITYMVIGVKDELDSLEDLHINPKDMFNKIDEKRNEMLGALKQNLTDFLDKSSVFGGDKILNKEGVDYTGVNVAGGVAAIGGALTFITQLSVLDITGGIATGLGLIVAGGIAITKKGKYIKAVKEALSRKREDFEESLSNNLISYFNQIKNKINDQFTDFDYHLKSEENQIKDYDEMVHELKNQLDDVENEIYKK
jgi:GTPase Era involved in 16S rRNA processing